VDILAEEFNDLAPYQFGGNNPVMFNDPSGAKSALNDSKWKWHHADPFFDIPGLAQEDQEGFGLDGFGVGSSDGGGGGGFGNGNWASFYQSLFDMVGLNSNRDYSFHPDKDCKGGFTARWWEFGGDVDGMLGGVISAQKHFSDGGSTLGNLWDNVKSGYDNYVDPVFVWINKNVNPITPVVELITGKEYSREGLVNDKPRLTSGAQTVMALIPFGRVAGVGERMLVNGVAHLGLGSTGRTIAGNLTEQLAMEETMSNPSIGRVLELKNGMTDNRWLQADGWVKMSNEAAHGVEIHYVGQWQNGVLNAVDDFKFIGGQ
jgi:hypothetical protein